MDQLATMLAKDQSKSAIVSNLEALLKNGANPNHIVNILDAEQVVDHLDILKQYNADIDVNGLASHLGPKDCGDNLITLLQNGADVNIILNVLDSTTIISHLSILQEYGLNISEFINAQSEKTLTDNLQSLLKQPVNIDDLISKIGINELIRHLDLFGPEKVHELFNKVKTNRRDIDAIIKFLDYGIDVQQVMSQMSPSDIAYNLEKLAMHNANIDINDLVQKLQPEEIIDNLTTLKKHHANIDVKQVLRAMRSLYGDRGDRLQILQENGLDIDDVVKIIDPDVAIAHKEELIQRGADREYLERQTLAQKSYTPPPPPPSLPPSFFPTKL